MAFPTVAARTESAVTTAGTTHTVNFVQTTGDLVVIFFDRATSGTLTSPSNGFTNLTNVSANFHVLYKQLVGGEGGSMTVTTTSSKSAAIAYNIQGHENPATQAPQISANAFTTSANPNPGSLTPTGGAKDYLWIAAFAQLGAEADDDTWVTAVPTNFGNLVQKTTGTGGSAASNGQVAAADWAQNLSVLDPAAFTTAQSLQWFARVVAIHPFVVLPDFPYPVLTMAPQRWEKGRPA